MSKLFKKLKTGLEDAIAYEQGKLRLRSEFIEIPEPPAEHKPKDIKKKASLSKAEFALYYQALSCLFLATPAQLIQRT